MILKFKPIEPHTHFSNISSELWNSWTWQASQSLVTLEDFETLFELSAAEKEGFARAQGKFKTAATPYYASLIAEQGSALRPIVMPSPLEDSPGEQQMRDPLAEVEHSPTPRIIHRYSDRVIFLVTDTCSVYCRFCTRKRFTGQDQGLVGSKAYADSISYIKNHPGIREVIFSGGDPLTLSNSILDRVLRDVREISHVEIIRIGSRMPVVCPMRIDEKLCQILRAHAPVFLMSHYSHPKELTAQAATAITCLVDHGIPVFNQMVLINGVNNSAAIIQALNRRLLYLRAKPYYMFQCDPSEGTDHLRTTVESSESIYRELWGHVSGLAMPIFILDIPNGGGKTSLTPNFQVSSENGVRNYKGWDKRQGSYINPIGEMIIPPDQEDYLHEWEELRSAKTLQF
jgi:lysine 2,3-aminomutase